MTNADYQVRYRQRLKIRCAQLFGYLLRARCTECGTEQDVEWAHVRRTDLDGPGRGLDRRYRDVLRHPDCYVPLCRECHVRYDRGDTT